MYGCVYILPMGKIMSSLDHEWIAKNAQYPQQLFQTVNANI